MKKRLLVGLVCFALVGCSSNDAPSNIEVAQNKIVGKWVCTTEYSDLNFTTVDRYEFAENGTLNAEETISYKRDYTPLFNYKTTGKGKWVIKKNQLSLNLVKQPIERASSVLREKALEGKIFKMLQDLDGQPASTSIVIQKFSDNKFEFKQFANEGNSYAGRCVRGK